MSEIFHYRIRRRENNYVNHQGGQHCIHTDTRLAVLPFSLYYIIRLYTFVCTRASTKKVNASPPHTRRPIMSEPLIPNTAPASASQGLCGLTNIGNTCYGNAILQAIRHHVDLTLFFIQDKHVPILKKDRPSNEMIQSYVHLLKLMWTSTGGCEKTAPFWKDMVRLAVKHSYEQFQYPHPHDSHEFLGFLLDQFHEGLAQPVHMHLRSTSKDAEISSALSFWKASFEKGYSPLVELAFSLRRKCTRCDFCKAESITWETFNMLDVTVPEDNTKTHSLVDLILSDGKGDELTDYACLKCSPTKTKATVTRSNWRLGSWLIITLKRFDNKQKRLNAVIDFPLETTFTSTFHPTSPEPSFRDTYELFATVNHHGAAGGGHYTAQAKHPVTGQWNLFDDERCVPITAPHIDMSSYVVMYRKKSD